MKNSMDKYKTIAKEAQAEIVEKRSRFIANVMPVSSEEEAIYYLNIIKQRHWDARHNVYAYVIKENNLMRYSDDGEPSGTAGVPVLEILKRENLTDLIVVVTRYFGGVLLGTGGLVHAYSKAAKEGINAAGITDMILCRKLVISCDYNLMGKIQYEVAAFEDAFCSEINYGESVEICVYVAQESESRFVAKIIDATNAAVSIEQGGIEYFEKSANF